MNAPVLFPSMSFAVPDDASSDITEAGLRRDRAIAVAALGFALGYATFRYNVFKGVPWSDWPAYTVNKALAVAGLWLLALAAVRKWRRARPMHALMAWGGGYVLSHALLSLALLSGPYFPKLIVGGALTLTGSLSLLAGVIATALLELGARVSARWAPPTARRAMIAILILSAIHTILPGFIGWFAPKTWPGMLPPLTLLAGVPPLMACLILSRVQ